MKNNVKRLYRCPDNSKIAGICEGFSRYFEVDVVLVRLLFLIFIFIGAGLLAYLICWIVMPSYQNIKK
tara:strand:+ start:95 stop:298 length:204 start_codon:yes stop_codon:yes gene_type:complete